MFSSNLSDNEPKDEIAPQATHEIALRDFLDTHFAHLDARVLPSKSKFVMGVHERCGTVIIEFNPKILAKCALSADEAQALAAHEMAHWKNGDTSAKAGIQWTAGFLACLALLFVWPLASLAVLGFLHLAKAKCSRRQEWKADSGALAWTTPDALGRALTKIERVFGEPFWHWFRSHPRLADRVYALRQEKRRKQAP